MPAAAGSGSPSGRIHPLVPPLRHGLNRGTILRLQPRRPERNIVFCVGPATCDLEFSNRLNSYRTRVAHQEASANLKEAPMRHSLAVFCTLFTVSAVITSSLQATA